MRSHLTRRVFRRLLSCQPLVHHRSLHGPARPRSLGLHGRITYNASAQRTMLNVFQRQSKDTREPLLDPGMEKMLELDKRLHLIARFPPAAELVEAFRAFVDAKRGRNLPIEDFHAAQVLQTLQNLEERNDGDKDRLTVQDLDSALVLLATGRGNPTSVHNKLARALYNSVQRRSRRQSSAGEEERIKNFVSILCKTGDSVEARRIVEEHWKEFDLASRDDSQLWATLLRGLAFEDNENEMLQILQHMDERGVELSREVYKVMMSYYASKDNVQQIKKWGKQGIISPVDGNVWSAESDFRTVLEFCLRNQELEWGQSIMTVNMEAPEQRTWHAIFAAAAATGRGVDEIDRMLSVMSRRAQEDTQEQIKPDIDIFNGLIRFAISMNDPYTAERYFSLAEKWNAEPDARTYILQVEYRLMADDLGGAIAAYEKMREQEIEEDEDWWIMNKMLEKFTSSSRVTSETIAGIAEDLSDRRRLFPCETVIALCKYHIKRDEYFEAVDLLHTYAYQYSISQRMEIRDFLVDITIDPATDTARAWDTYMIFHQVFDLESRRDVRNKVMTAFFNRKRPDLATHIFTRMSKHPRADTRPDVDTYVRAFEGVALNGEPEGLEAVHNLLKLDTEVEPCTRLSNALMLAYTAVGAPWRALEIWLDISTSAEGPTHSSLHIALRACEKTAFGDATATAIWRKLRHTDIVISKDLFASYVGALAGNQKFDEVVELIENMREVVDEEPDEFTIGTFYNATFGVNFQQRVADWAADNYPDVWQRIEEGGFNEDEMGMRQAKAIDRSLRA